MKNKKYKMLIELVAQKETPMGAIGIKEGIDVLKKFGDLAKKLKFDCYVKGYPKNKSEHVPTNKEYHIKTLEDLVQLDDLQLEFFMDDLRNWHAIMKNMATINKSVDFEAVKSKDDGMHWIDSGLSEAKVKMETSSKL